VGVAAVAVTVPVVMRVVVCVVVPAVAVVVSVPATAVVVPVPATAVVVPVPATAVVVPVPATAVVVAAAVVMAAPAGGGLAGTPPAARTRRPRHRWPPRPEVPLAKVGDTVQRRRANVGQQRADGHVRASVIVDHDVGRARVGPR